MFAGLKRWWSKKRLRGLPIAKRGLRPLRPLASCMNFLILLDPEDVRACEQIDLFVQELKKEHKRFDVCTCSIAKEIPRHLREHNYIMVLHSLDLNWYARPISERTQWITRNTYDLLVDLTHEESLPLLWITELSIASIKVGFEERSGVRYDLLIASGARSSTRERIELLHQYLGDGLSE
ncbi:MAG: DUF6913 domain-containing protein [Bacteroides sp.]